jgi:hypothetical protein
MDLISSFSNGMAAFSEPVISFLKGIAGSTGLSINDSPDSWSGVLMSGAAGVAAAVRRLIELGLKVKRKA